MHFDNFIWLTDDELRGVVHKVLPLFNGELPESGNSLGQVDAALAAALAQNGVTGAVVEHEAVMPTSAEPVHAMRFFVAQPMVLLNSVQLEGLDPALARAVGERAAKLRKMPYEAGESQTSTIGWLLSPYRDAGYLKATVRDLQVVGTQATPGRVLVDVKGRVEAGPVYRVKALTFADSPLMSGAAFGAIAQLHGGDVASQKALLASVKPVEAAYQKQGYFEAYVETEPSFDDAAHTVSYALTVIPGEQYRVRSVTVNGLTPAARAEFDTGWRLTAGDLYDPGYVQAFLTNNTAVRGLAGYAGGFKAVSDPQTRLVDLTVSFVSTTGGRSGR